ncbi:Alpha/Beta hydrolase protein [Fusarium avenaceum]|nr:Alpha/Beta hydrolase protein [Fusarium avenaceum]
MNSFPDPDDFSRFADFTILTTTYKTVAGHPIQTDVLVPKHLTSSMASTKPCPVLLRYHGGGLMSGSSLYPGFFQLWYLELAARHSAVIVQRELPAFVKKETGGRVSVDTGRIHSTGESAGGYLSIMMGLSHPKETRVVTAAYLMLDLADEHFIKGPETPTLGMRMPRSVVDEHYEKIRKGEHGVFSTLLPLEKRHLFPLERLEDGMRFPRGGVFVWHGEGDSVVPVKGSVKFEQAVRELDPELVFRLTLRDGEHGFDASASIDDRWMEEGLRGLVEAWLE